MQRVGFQSFAGIFLRHAIQGAGAHEIDAHTKKQNHDGEEARTQRTGVEEQALDRFPDDVDGGEKQQSSFDKGGETFDFAVTVEMIRVGRLVRDAHGKKRDDGGEEVEPRMHRFR